MFVKVSNISICTSSNYKILIAESILASGAPSDNSLPVVFETTEDSTLNNLTRSDVNCDKTGTCYDGKNNKYKLKYAIKS